MGPGGGKVAVGVLEEAWEVDIAGPFVLLLLLLLLGSLELVVGVVIGSEVDMTTSPVLLDEEVDSDGDSDSDVDIAFARGFCTLVGSYGTVGAVMDTELEGRAAKLVGECTLGAMRTTSSFSKSNSRLRATSELKHAGQRSAHRILTTCR